MHHAVRVSHQIRTLEEEFRRPLFERRTRSVALTEDGSSLFTQIDPLLRELDDVAARFTTRRQRRRILRITLLPFFASEMFIPRLNGFANAHASIDIRLETTDTPGASHPPTSDASVLLYPAAPSELCAHPLFALSLTPACSPQLAGRLNADDPERLCEATLIVHKSRPNAWSDWFSLIGARLSTQPKVIHLDSTFAVARAAERGLGVAFVPMPLSNAWFESGLLVSLSEGELETSDRYYFVYRAEDSNDEDMLEFRDWGLRAFLRERKVTAFEDERISAVASE